MSRYARALHDTTALRLSAASIVSENVRAERIRQQQACGDRPMSESLRRHVAETMMVASTAKAINSRGENHDR